MMPKKIQRWSTALLAVLCLPAWALLAEKPASAPALTQEYVQWLESVHYIITPVERDSFLGLGSDKERRDFITLFWKLRDPSKGTSENEFRDEHLRRFQYANQYFRSDAPAGGWRSDRGRIYILLGPAINQNEVHQEGLRQVLIWEYLGDPRKGLPPVFRIVFYRKQDGAPYKLYVPAVDGPAALLRSSIGMIDASNFAAVYDKIHSLEPAVADVALSLVPGERVTNFSPSLHDPVLLAHIADLPRRDLSDAYARNFRHFHGVVQVDERTDYIGVSGAAHVLPQPLLGMSFLHFVLRPERISVLYSEQKDQYYFTFRTIVTLRRGDTTVLQYSRDYSLYKTKAELDRDLGGGILIGDLLPVPPGEYKLVTVVQNLQNHEIGYCETPVFVPAAAPDGPRLYGPVLSYEPAGEVLGIHSPYRVLGRAIKMDPLHIFGRSERIRLFCWLESGSGKRPKTVEVRLASVDHNRPLQQEFSLAVPEGESCVALTRELPDLAPGNYTLSAHIPDDASARVIGGEQTFSVSPQAVVPHPPTASRNVRMENEYSYFLLLAAQYAELKQTDAAVSCYEEALRRTGLRAEVVAAYGDFLLHTDRAARALELAETVRTMPLHAVLKGRALYRLRRYREAAEELQRAAQVENADIIVLNELGICWMQVGEKARAEAVFKLSLQQRADQPDIRRCLDQVQRLP